jgi:outer membrane receptor for ferrienterochelin and colicins
MFRNIIYIGVFFLFNIAITFAQTKSKTTLFGIVTNEKEEVLIGATVFWKDAKIGTTTNETGHFLIERDKKSTTLVVRYIGFTPIELEVLPHEDSIWVEVAGINEIKQVTVTGHTFGNVVSVLETRNVESISRKELKKAPCCNLSESFETSGAVDVTYTNALTGVKEIQMLGLRGIYSQFLIENRPTMGGIATPFAFEFIPGTWLDGIVLAKGASTVKNGNAGITGQLNIDLVKPATDKPVFVNGFTSIENRGELNVHLNKKGKGKYSNGFLFHGSAQKNKWDRNDDNFFDSQTKSQINGLYRLQFEGDAGCGSINVQALSDRRTGGQINPISGIPGLFQVLQNNDRVEVFGKLGREGLFGKPYNQIGNMFGASYHRNNSLFGSNKYAATQTSFYYQSLYQSIFKTTDHKIVVAPNIQYDNITEKVNEEDLSRRDIVPGIMAEYTYSHLSPRLDLANFVMVLGARLDYHNRFGTLFTPRMSAKYNFTRESIVRISAGRGFRTPNVIAENISLLASNRLLDVANDLGVEEAWNYGMNFTQTFKINKKDASFSVDAYRTDFVRQVLIDVEKDYSKVYFYNLEGKSYSNSLLAVFQWNFAKGFDLKTSYKINDVRATFADGKLKTVPLVAKHRGLITLDYETSDKKWRFHATTHFVGKQRLPDNSQIPHDLVHDFPAMSPSYNRYDAQITHIWKKWEFYIGGENLSNFQQHHAIISADNPQSPYFNASQVWAPMMGLVGYAGFRYTIL